MKDQQIFFNAYKNFLDNKNHKCAELIMMISIAAFLKEEELDIFYADVQKAFNAYWITKAQEKTKNFTQSNS